MPNRIRTFRTRPPHITAGVLLCFAGLTSMSRESVSFGHGHTAGGLIAVHHHLFLGEHQHSGDSPDEDHHPEERHPHEHGTPKPKRTTSTIPMVATALFRPAVIQGLAAPPDDPALLQILVAPPLPARSLAQPLAPRPPPAVIVVPDALV